MVARQSVCLRGLSDGARAREVGFGRFLDNDRVTVGGLVEGWSDLTAAAAAGRHVLGLQDTSECNFSTTPGRRRGLGEIGKGSGRGLLVHAMLAVDAGSGACLGLVAGEVYTRAGRVATPHARRALKDKESRRWIDAAERAKEVLARAAMVTVVADRESDIYTQWASPRSSNFHFIGRVMHDRAVAGGGLLSGAADKLPFVSFRDLELMATHKRAGRKTSLSLRFGAVEILRPSGPDARGLPKTVALTLVEVVERDPPEGAEPVRWRLLTTHAVNGAADAWQIVDWYRLRWTIEQLFRLMKTDGLRLEDSQLESAGALLKLAAIATKAAATILQLVQAREGEGGEPASVAFDPTEIDVLESLEVKYRAPTPIRANPHERHSLAWAAWLVSRLGGWDGYPKSRKPGPITTRNGYEYFQSIVAGWNLRDVCIL